MQAGLVILSLKIAVFAVTLLWLSAMVALALGNKRLHGRINIVFFSLTLAALVALEIVVRIIHPGLFNSYFKPEERTLMTVHLSFAIPSAALLFIMLFSGLTRRRSFHIATGILFAIFWTGTFITGIFFLPHDPR